MDNKKLFILAAVILIGVISIWGVLFEGDDMDIYNMIEGGEYATGQSDTRSN